MQLKSESLKELHKYGEHILYSNSIIPNVSLSLALYWYRRFADILHEEQFRTKSAYYAFN